MDYLEKINKDNMYQRYSHLMENLLQMKKRFSTFNWRKHNIHRLQNYSLMNKDNFYQVNYKVQKVLDATYSQRFMFQYTIISIFPTKLQYQKMRKLILHSITNKQCIHFKHYQQKKI